MEQRTRLPENVLSSFLGRLATLPSLATKAELSELRADAHRTLNAQTWRLLGGLAAISGIVSGVVELRLKT